MTASVSISFVLESAWLALTPWERWSAARTLSDDPEGGRGLIIVCIVVLVVLVALFVLVSMRRVKRQRKSTRESFEEYCRQRGLSPRECQLLAIVANRAGLKRAESVFTMGAAFGAGAAKVIKEGIGGEYTAEDAALKDNPMYFIWTLDR